MKPCWYSNVKNSLKEERRISNSILETVRRDLVEVIKYLRKETIRTNRVISLLN